MSDMPDFDSMTPEQITEWMESLAVRQGATEGLTTAASMDIDEVDEADERLEGMGDYKPYGMSDEDWEKMQAREAEEKAAKLAAQSAPEPQAVAPPEPAPDPIPEPVAEEPTAVSDDGTPDFDSMTPEEMMEWMESLAVRQGATEGITTAASMNIKEVDESDERLEGMGDYKPYAMSDEDWEKMQAREAEEKAAKLAAQSAPEPQAVAADDEYAYEDDDEYDEYDDDEEYSNYQDDSEEVVVGNFEDSDELIRTDLSALGFLGEEESTEESDQFSAIDFANLLPEETVKEDVEPAANPMDWLASLSGAEEEAAPDIGLSMADLGDLTGLGNEEPIGDPMDWLSSLSDSPSEDAIDFSALTAENSGEADEGSLEWMESLAASQGAPEDELVTDANFDIPMPDNILDDGPGYEEFSFEDATGIVQDTADSEPVSVLVDDDSAELVLDDPESWLDSLATGVSENEIPDDIFDGEEFATAERAEGEQFDNLADTVKSQMDSGKLGDSPDDINKFFESAFARAATRDDVPDYIDSDDDDDEPDDSLSELPVPADIPDWLQDSMGTMPSELEDDEQSAIPNSKKTATAEMMVADLGLDDDLDDVDIPDWLQSGADQDTGAIDLDIFDPEEEDFDEEVFELNLADMAETQDTWVDAFSSEDTGELATWYDDAITTYKEDSEPITTIDENLVVALDVANLPIESKLVEGTAQNIPAWLDSNAGQSIEVAAVHDDNMDWLNEDVGSDDGIDMPDWLQDTVDDSVTDGEDLPDWLAGEEDIAADEIPDWLRETMDDEDEASIPDQLFLGDDVLVETPEPSTPLPVPVAQSPAPISVSDDKIDAVAYLRSAKEKFSAKDVDGAMLDYEQVIRANKALPQVEKELQRIVEDKDFKRNPSVNRVLGDVLMRQGKLQQALDIYRKALNML